jgi:hypothetical protein
VRKEEIMSSWLKAGLVGGAVLVVLNLLGLIPLVGIVCCFLGLVAYAGIGALAAYWMPPVREAGPAAGQGALAAVVASLIGGIINTIVWLIQSALVPTADVLSQIPPELLQQLQDAGGDPQMFNTFAGPLGAAFGGSCCCLGGVILAAILGAIGGAIYAGVKPD